MQIGCIVTYSFGSKSVPMNLEIYLLILIVLAILNLLVFLLKGSKDYSTQFSQILVDLTDHFNRNENRNKTEFSNSRIELSQSLRANQEVMTNQLNTYADHQNKLLHSFQNQLVHLNETNYKSLNDLRMSMDKSIADMRQEVNLRLESIQKDNHNQLERMRHTVDEKLQKTLEERLGKSFELVSQRLMEVQNGLGEMKTLANGVGDLKKVLSNVKTRGVLGEIQLGNILEQLLTPEQYGLNVATIPDSSCHVEFAIKLPGKERDGAPLWLPIDSKFPMDRYHRLQEAYEQADMDLISIATKQLEQTIKLMAKDIKEKYIAPPHTTDFGILFLPTEGLYADVVRNTGLIQYLQREYKIMVAGPTNLAALLNSLQMGFRSLAIEKRTSEVWKVLSSVKTEFGKFGGVLDKVQTKLRQASDTIDKVGVRSRAIERQLRTVEQLPESAHAELPFDDGIQIEDFVEPPVLS